MKCEDCNVKLNESGFCPICGHRYIFLNEAIDIVDGYGYKKKDKSLYKSKKHTDYYDEKHVCEKNYSMDKYVMRHTKKDRLNDEYEEIVETFDGEVIHICKEKLSEHINRGKAKKV